MLATRRQGLRLHEFGLLLGAALIIILILSAMTAANIRWSMILPGGGGFYAIWAGSREFLFQHGDPYGATAAARAQILAYGEPAGASRNPLRLEVPFFLMPFFFPVCLISDPEVGRGVWATLAELALVGAGVLSMRLARWNPPRAMTLGIGLFALLGFPSVFALVDGSPVILLLLLFLGILSAVENENDELAGAMGVMTLWRWEVGLPFLLVLAMRCVRERRWRVFAGFGMTLTVLTTISFLVYPGWMMPFLVSTVATLRSVHGVSTHSALALLLPEYAVRLSMALTVVSLALMLMEYMGAHALDFRRQAWASSVVLALTPLLGLRSEMANLVMLVPGLVMVAASGAHRKSSGAWLSALLLVLILGAPWVFLLVSPSGVSPRAEALLFLSLSSAVVVAMYWTRWWLLRPPRTWLDEIRVRH